jgi:Mg-chelatase subunit ChlD
VEFRLSNPQWVYAGLVLVPVVLLGLAWFSAMGTVRRWSAILLRTFLFTMIVLLLAGASAVTRTDKFTAVLVVDISGSMDRPVGALTSTGLPDDATPDERAAWAQRPAMDLIRRFVREASAIAGPDDSVGIVAFAGQAAVVMSPTRAGLEGSGQIDWPVDLPLGEGTNIEQALRLARAMMPPDAAGRIILATDGVQTSGDALAAARQSVSGGGRDTSDTPATQARGGRGVVPISVLPIEYEITREVFVDSVDAPPRAAAGATATVRVTLTSTGPATGTLRLLDDQRTIDLNGTQPGDGQRVTLAAGANVIPLDVPLGEGRVHRFKAVFEPDVEAGAFTSDTLARNNTGEGFTVTPGRGTVLVIDGVNDGTGTTLSATLREGGFLVDTRRAENFPADLLQLGGFDLVVLENVPSENIPQDKQALLVSYVKDLGGGLIMVGGPQSFGAGGWRGSQVESILPVRLDLPDKLVVAEIAIAFVLDNSGSMNFRVMGSMRSQQEIANEAAALAIRSLDKGDLVGVTTFNESYDVLVPVGPNTNSEATAGLVRKIGSGGGTRAGPAIREAAEQLSKVKAKSKHIIVMSDGKSSDSEELPGLSGRLNSPAGGEITISTISVGDRGDPETMARMAERGGGVHYNVINPEVLPKIFLKAVRVVRSPMIREEPFSPRLAQVGSPLLAGVGPIGELGGLSLTRVRPEPTVTTALVNEREGESEPVLAHWQVELGRVTAFTSDAHKWAAKWLKSPNYRAFWLQAARLTSRAELSGSGLDARAVAADGTLSVRLEAFAPGSTPESSRLPMDGLEVPVTVYSPTGVSRDMKLTQTGPGVYEGTIPAEEAGTYITLLRPKAAPTGTVERRLPPVIAGVSSRGGVEYRQLRSNAELLRQIAAETGGRVLSLGDPLDAKFFDRGGIKPLDVLSPVWKPMLAWTLVLLLLDLATRRIAWDRWVNGGVGGMMGVAAHAVRERGSQASATLDALRKGGGAETLADSKAAPLGYEPPVLTARDATMLARAARDQRRARVMADAASAQSQRHEPGSPNPAAPATPAEPAPEPPSESGLLAAKRRAASRFQNPDA